MQLPANVLLEVYLDTCHRGTGLKAIDMQLDRKSRYLPPLLPEAFARVQNKLSRAPLRTKIRADLMAGKYSQIPLLDCEATKRSAIS